MPKEAVIFQILLPTAHAIRCYSAAISMVTVNTNVMLYRGKTLVMPLATT